MLQARVVGLGSASGDDQAAWRAVALLQDRLPAGVEAVAVADAGRLLEFLDGCGKLVVVDAVQSGRPAGTILRLAWPDNALQRWGGSSSHGLSVGGVLALAERLGKLPPIVVLLGVEIDRCEPAGAMSDAVAHALPELCRRIIEEVTPGG